VDFWFSALALQRLNDIICIENGYSIIKDKKLSKGHYGTWLDGKKEASSRELLEQLIDKVLAQKPASFDDFMKMLEAENCEVKRSRRSIRLPNKKGFLRLNSLGDDYKEDAIKERIAGKRVVSATKTATADTMPTPQTGTAPQAPKFNLLIDVQNSIKAQNSAGYERWSKVFNLRTCPQ
jgi:hypothetical protein